MAITRTMAQPTLLALIFIFSGTFFDAFCPPIHIPDYYGAYGYGNKQSIGFQRAKERALIRGELDTVREYAAAPGRTPLEIERSEREIAELNRLLDGLVKPDDLDAKIGKALLQGFAGQDAQLFTGEKIESAAAGLGLGLAVASAGAVSKVVGKHVENTTERVVGSAWEAFITKIVNVAQWFNNGLFHGGYEPYSSVTLRGLSTMVKNTFEDLSLMLKDGLQNVLRGQDMTLRPTEDQQQQAAARLKGWEVLCEAYTRQFDHIITILDSRIQHYDEQADITFYASEIKRCIADVKGLLTQVKNIRELDERLDSNKNLMNAFKRNILNLFDRLIELVEPAVQNATKPAAKQSQQSGYGDRDVYPHGFAG
jgi:hypothetical protein